MTPTTTKEQHMFDLLITGARHATAITRKQFRPDETRRILRPRPLG